MNAQELFTKDGKPAGVYFCEKCRLVFKDKEFADDCCACRYCGLPIDDKTRHFTGAHSDCWYAEDRKRDAQRLAEAELVEQHDGWIYSPEGWGQDGYMSPDEVEEILADSIETPEGWPEFLFCCEKEHPRELDVADIVENYADGLYEDAADDVTVPDSLVQGIKDFNAANADLHSWMVDYSRKVKAPPVPAELLKAE